MKMISVCSFIFMQIKVFFIRMVSHLDSLWNRGTRELGNGLLGLFMYSRQNRTLPLKFDCKSTLQKEIHSCHTRNSHLYRLPLCRSNIKQFSVFTKDLNFTTPWVPKSSIRPPLSPLKKHLRRFFVITVNSFHTNMF